LVTEFFGQSQSKEHEMITIVIVILIVSLIFLLYNIKVAPLGWEDEDGFHEGKQ